MRHCQRQHAEHRRQGCHEDGFEPDASSFNRGVDSLHAVATLNLNGLDQHDGVVDNDAGEHDHADPYRHGDRCAGNIEAN